MKKQNGFTLIELIVVIVILGILAATAMPKFVNLSNDARIAGVQGVAGALASANAINYAARSVSANNVSTASAVVAGTTDCAAFAAARLEGGVPAGYAVTGTALTCTVNSTDPSSAVNVTLTAI